MDKVIRQGQIKPAPLLLALVVGLHLALMPILEVRAAIPVLAAVGMFLKTPLGKSVATSLAIHAAVLAVEFHNTASATPPSTDVDKKLEIKLNPKDPLSTPPGWTPGTASNPDPVPPSTAASTGSQANTAGLSWYVTGTVVTNQSSYTSACVAANSTWTAPPVLVNYKKYQCNHPTFGPRPYYAEATCVSGTLQDVAGSPSCGPAVVSCSSGYTNSGGTCSLSDASIVQKPEDGKAEIKRVGNVLYTDARDAADGLPPGVTVDPDKVTFVDSQGGKWETIINADGTSTTKESKPRTDGSGKTDVTTTAYSAPNATTGAVEMTGQSVQSFAGTGALQSGIPDATGSGDGAKESTLQGVKSTLDATKTAQDADRTAAETSASSLPGQLTGAAAPGQDTVAGLGLPTQGQFLAPDVSAISSALPSSSGGCVALDVDLPYLGNLHIAPCAVVTAISPMVNALVVALGVAGGVFAVLGRREET